MSHTNQGPYLDEYGSVPLDPQQRFYGQGGLNSPSRDSFQSNIQYASTSQFAASSDHLNPIRDNYSGYERSTLQMDEKDAAYARKPSRRRPIIIGCIVATILIIAGVGVGVYFALRGKDEDSSSSPSSGTKGGGTVKAVTGGDGSQVMLEDGSTFAYSNSFGGHWYYDPNDPFNNGAKAQSWTPALNETFRYGVDRIRGVNFGGWLNIEPFMAPALFEKYGDITPRVVDEWTLQEAMRADTAGGGISQLEEHYKTFITEKDFHDVAAAGLNYIRLPIPYWAIEVRDNEPYEPHVCWKYVLKAIAWARKYGLRINLDLHAVPGSQNSWNHSGRLNKGVNLLNGPMGLANAQRTLDYIRIIAEFIHQPQYRNVVTMFCVLNEPREPFIGAKQLESFSAEAYRVVREVTGNEEGVWVSIHEGFRSWGDWDNFLPNAHRVTIDYHPYIAFGDQVDKDWSERTQVPCDSWAQNVQDRLTKFGLMNAGEFSNAINDCGLYLNGVEEGVRYDGSYVPERITRAGSCDKYTDWPTFTDERKEGIKQFAMASMDALHNYFFWNWKIGNSSVSGKVETPAWSYSLGLENGWMPKDPREADGFCGDKFAFNQQISDGSGDVNYAPYPWPPTSINNAGSPSTMPQYTPTGAVPTLPGGTLTISGVKPTKTADVGNGWANPDDQAGLMVPIEGCTYLDPWVGDKAAVPPACRVARREALPQPTQPPAL
ncbi:glycoside hydrolase family 5 protein [Moniliophthora roreri]|nr:glycoside hydrolase family 5 protein [Moniliophthora roreri]